MASTAENRPNRNEPCRAKQARQSVHMASMRATLALASALKGWALGGRHIFPHIHGAFAAQRGKPSVHLGRERPSLRAGGPLGRPQLGGREFFIEIFENRQSFPYANLAILEGWNLARGRDPRNGLLKIRIAERHHLFLESKAGDPHCQPWAQRPRGIVLIADQEPEPYLASLNVTWCRSAPGWRGAVIRPT
jgi:hypothetical protein